MTTLDRAAFEARLTTVGFDSKSLQTRADGTLFQPSADEDVGELPNLLDDLVVDRVRVAVLIRSLNTAPLSGVNVEWTPGGFPPFRCKNPLGPIPRLTLVERGQSAVRSGK